MNVLLSCILKCVYLFCAKRGFLVGTAFLLVLLVLYQLHKRGTRVGVNYNVLLTIAIRDCLISEKEGLSLGLSRRQRSNTSQKCEGQR